MSSPTEQKHYHHEYNELYGCHLNPIAEEMLAYEGDSVGTVIRCWLKESVCVLNG